MARARTKVVARVMTRVVTKGMARVVAKELGVTVEMVVPGVAVEASAAREVCVAAAAMAKGRVAGVSTGRVATVERVASQAVPTAVV